MPTQYTPSQMKLFNALVKTGLRVLCEYPILRDGEFNREGKPKSYVADLLINKKLIVEVEGKGSASADNPERENYLIKKGYRIHHVSNEEIKKDLGKVGENIKVLAMV